MNSRMVMAIVAGVVVVLISFAFYPTLVQANDVFYRQYVNHCILPGGGTTVKLHDAALNSYPVIVSGTGCKVSIAVAAAGSTALFSEDGSSVGSAGGAAAITEYIIPSGVWNEAKGITQQFGSINKLLVSLVPLMLVVAFIASSWGALHGYATGEGAISRAVTTEVGTLVLAMVGIFLAPTFLEFANDAMQVSESGVLVSTSQFGTIINLIFGILPLGYTIGIIILATKKGMGAVSGMRSQMSM